MSTSARRTSAASPAAPEAPPAGLALWWLAVRPKTLSLAVAPVAVGAALAFADTGGLALGPVGAALVGALAIQAGTNLHNDAADFERGADAPGRAGPRRVTAEGWASAATVRAAAYLAFALAAAVGLYLVWVGGWPIAALGSASILAALAYTGGPRPIAYTPLGEVFVLAFFGIGAVGGTYWLQTATLSWLVLAAGFAVGLPAAAVLAVNNTRDRTSDAGVGKRTFAVRFGHRAALGLYTTLMGLPFVLLAVLVGYGYGAGAALPLACLPIAVRLVRRVATTAPGPAFNPLLAATARFQLAFAVLLSVGLAW